MHYLKKTLAVLTVTFLCFLFTNRSFAKDSNKTTVQVFPIHFENTDISCINEQLDNNKSILGYQWESEGIYIFTDVDYEREKLTTIIKSMNLNTNFEIDESFQKHIAITNLKNQ